MIETNCEEIEAGVLLAQGTVLEIRDDGYAVACREDILLCMRSAGCLIDPAIEDKVLVSLENIENGSSYVLTVLERARKETPVSLTLHENAVLIAGPDMIAINGRRSIVLQTKGNVTTTADRIDMHAREGRWMVRSLSMMGLRMESFWTECQNTASHVKNIFITQIQHLVNSHRHVEGLDETHASNIRLIASETLSGSGRSINHTASDIVKIDGRKIHLG